MEECTYFWGVNTSWGINTAESKRHLNQEDNQAPQPTESMSRIILITLALLTDFNRLVLSRPIPGKLKLPIISSL
jgi:hypothetical protein